MREISRRTEGPSKPPTLRIYLSFSLLLLPTSCVLPFSQLTRLFLRRALRHLFVPALNCFAPFPLPLLSIPFPAFHLDQNTKIPHLFRSWFCRRPQRDGGLAFLCSDIYNCRVELWNVKWIKGNRYLGGGASTWQQVMLLKPADFKIGAALKRGRTLLWAALAVFPSIVLDFYDWQRVQPQTLTSGQEIRGLRVITLECLTTFAPQAVWIQSGFISAPWCHALQAA